MELNPAQSNPIDVSRANCLEAIRAVGDETLASFSLSTLIQMGLIHPFEFVAKEHGSPSRWAHLVREVVLSSAGLTPFASAVHDRVYRCAQVPLAGPTIAVAVLRVAAVKLHFRLFTSAESIVLPSAVVVDAKP